MVTWTRAFKAAALFVLYSILWDIIGGAIMFFGIITLQSAAPTTTTIFGTTARLQPNPYQLVDGIIILIIGFVLLLLGNIATFFKVNTDLITEDIGETYQEEEKPQIVS